jgi:hypothetical protein
MFAHTFAPSACCHACSARAVSRIRWCRIGAISCSSSPPPLKRESTRWRRPRYERRLLSLQLLRRCAGRFRSNSAGREMIQPAPRAPELPGRGKSGALGDRLHVEPGSDKQFTGQRHAHPVHVFGDAHAGVVVEKPGKITRTRSSCAGKRSHRPIPRGIGGHDILNPMDHGMDVIAALKLRGQLWIGSAPPQIDDKVAGDGDCASMTRHLRYDV